MSTDFRTTNLELIAHAYASQVRSKLADSLLDSLVSENGVQDDGATIWFCNQDGFSEITVWGGNEYDPDMTKMVTVEL